MTRLGAFVEFTGFGNGKGEISFNKLCTWTALQAFVFCIVTKRDPSWSLLSFGVVVIGAGFGLKGYLGAIKQNTLNASHASQTSVTLTGDLAAIAKEVRARRDTDSGIEPA